ncbi:MAG: helix-turn-helix transcriptional regulator [Enterococcus sp.]|nr:helix-turn-helix transcriptional regulator [Enterococcus sp.]
MQIGQIILEKRKEKKVTQQTLADFLGVSKASVSKWETGTTYPDITLLPLIAAYFDLSMDQLFAYEAHLSNKEIQRIYQMLQNTLNTESGSEVLSSLRRFVRRYYACPPFILQMGLFMINHYDYFPGESLKEKQQSYLKEAQGLFRHVKESATTVELIQKARDYEAYTALLLEKPDHVLALLGEYAPAYFPTESLIAAAFQMKKEEQRGIVTLQSALAQYVFVMMSGLTNYLQLLTNDEEKLTETYQRGRQLAQIFQLAQLNPVNLMNFQLSALFGFAQIQKEAVVLEILTDFGNVMAQTQFPVQLHGDAYFDQIQPWLEQLDLGTLMPRNTQNLQKELLELVLTHPLLAPYQTSIPYQKIQQIKEQQRE